MDYKAKAKDLTNRLAITCTQEGYDNIIEAALRESAAEALEKFAGHMKQVATIIEEPDHNRIAAKVETLDFMAATAIREAAALRAPEVKTEEKP